MIVKIEVYIHAAPFQYLKFTREQFRNQYAFRLYTFILSVTIDE
jgi:hypothetical protein